MSRQGPSVIADLLDRHGVVPKKAYGQHFLADPNLIDKVVSLAGVTGSDNILEVGAGTGALTSALAATGAHVLAYEVDQRMRPVLEETLAGSRVDVRYEDAMAVDLVDILAGTEWKLVANLPYNVGTPLLLEVLTKVSVVTSAVVMIQGEVADRLVARPATAAYGLPSVVVGLTAVVFDRFHVPPQVFVPSPSVESAVVRLDRVTVPGDVEGAIRLARAAFNQRRKMLRRSLAEKVTPDQFAAAGITSSARPEELTPEQFLDLAGVVSDG
ncbi:16S rRNA (adenine(1518)-N(6)/adenine(1519)-N(6))-dimethyltransferaseRsmA [soil metagenome]